MINFIKNIFKTKKLFIDVVREHLDKEEADNNLCDDTKIKHTYQLNNIKAFLADNNMETVTVNQIKYKHVEQLRTWLHTEIQCSAGHSNRHIKLCKAALDFAVHSEYIDHNTLSGIKSKRVKAKEPVSLTQKEFEAISEFKSKYKQQNIVLDLFLFQCLTGLSYMDLWLFKIESEQLDPGLNIDLVTCENGRGKTKKRYWAEFMIEAKNIYNKYDGSLPWVCNQSYNKILKKICKQVNIEKKVSTHTGRKTFATLKRNKGYSVPAISLMIGDDESTTVKHYITRNKELLVQEILDRRLKQNLIFT